MENDQQRNLSPEARLVAALNDPEYRQGFVEGHATDTIAFQLRAMRKAEGWDQKEVAERMGNPKAQPMISRYENPDYGKYSVATLLELAKAFDVALAVRFVPFSELVEWDLSSSPAKDLPLPFEKDSRLKEIASANGIENKLGVSYSYPKPPTNDLTPEPPEVDAAQYAIGA